MKHSPEKLDLCMPWLRMMIKNEMKKANCERDKLYRECISSTN